MPWAQSLLQPGVEHIFERKRPRLTGAKAGTHHEVEQYLVAWIGIQDKAYLDLILGQEFGQALSVANHHRNFRALGSGPSDMTEKTGMLGSSYPFLTEGQHSYQVALLSPSVEPHDQGQTIVHRAGIKC